MKPQRILWLFCILFSIVLSVSADISEDVIVEYRKRLSEIQSNNAVDYFQLGKWAKENKLSGPAKQYFNKALELKSGYVEAKEELSKCTNCDLPNNYFDLVKECRRKLSEIERKCANRLAGLAKHCTEKKLDEEFCLNEALKYDPNCKMAHEERGEMKTDNFGWVSKPDADKIKNGLREFNGKWLPQKEVERLRNNWENAWELKSGHYLLRTDISFDKAQIVLKDLENLYDALLNIFYGIDGFVLEPDQPFKVYYFNNKKDYDVHADKCGPYGKGANGYFAPGDAAAHLWPSDIESSKKYTEWVTEKESLFHECTHQFISIGTNGARKYVSVANSWISEGIACYSETFKDAKGKFFFGSPTSRSKTAKTNLNNGKYVPLKDFFQLTQREINADSGTCYPEALGLTLFFMQHEKYKLRFLEYIIAAHITVKSEKSFNEFMKIDDLDKLEKEWLSFIESKT